MRGATTPSWKIVPDGSAHLLAHCFTDPDGSPRVTTTVVGSRSRAIERDPRGRIWTVGVRLRSGALGLLTGLDASELTDRSTSFGSLWGAWGDRRASTVTSESTPYGATRQLLETVEVVAGGRARPWVARLFDDAVRARRGRGVSEVATQLGVAPRTLRRRCRHTTGLAPKRHLRIARLHDAIALSRQRPGASWSRIAALAGFSDQAHLVRDFQALIGETPVAFRSRGSRADSFKPGSGSSDSFGD